MRIYVDKEKYRLNAKCKPNLGVCIGVYLSTSATKTDLSKLKLPSEILSNAREQWKSSVSGIWLHFFCWNICQETPVDS